MLLPKLLTTLRGYTRAQFLADATAGVIVGIVALPLAVAFAIASGLPPERGLYTAVVAGFLISALGGSRVQIGGPTGAFVVVVSGVVHQYGVDGLIVATVMAGLILVLMGVVRLGAAIKFIPYPVTLGFTSGIAVIIFSTQVKDLLGIPGGAARATFVDQWTVVAGGLSAVNPATVVVAAASLAVILIWPRVSRRVPGAFVALIAATIAVRALDLPVETVGSRFGELRMGLPSPELPSISLATVRALLAPAFTIALLAAIESLLSAVVADGMVGGRHRSNMELVAQGVANIASPLFGGMPATGAIARTATNVKSGGRTPVAGMAHALTLLLITVLFGRYAALVPLATLAAILTVVAYHMSEWRAVRAEFRAPRSDVAVMVVTLLLTVLVDLTVAIEVGIVLAAFLFMKRMAEVTNVTSLTRELDDAPDEAEDPAGEPNAMARRVVPAGVEVYEINGPFFFGAAETFKDRLGQIAARPRVLIIRMRNVPAIDSTGLHALRELWRRSRREGTLVILSDVHSQPVVALERSGLFYEIGEENVTGNVDDALNRARAHLGLPVLPRPSFATATVARETPPGGVQAARP
jgi:SulP family sulfate permease